MPTSDHHLTGGALAAALDADGDPSSVVAVVATAGTTNAGIVDDLATVTAVAHERGLWCHVDAAHGGGAYGGGAHGGGAHGGGAHGGGALFSERARSRFAGIGAADSIAIDPHKWLFAPYDCAAPLYRDPSLAKAAHTQDATDLAALHTAPRVPGMPPAGGKGGGEDPWNPTDYAFGLSRRSRGLPLWFSLAVHGTEPYRDAVDAVLATARAAAELIDETPHTTLVREPELSIVLCRRNGWSPPGTTRGPRSSSPTRWRWSCRPHRRGSPSPARRCCTPRRRSTW